MILKGLKKKNDARTKPIQKVIQRMADFQEISSLLLNTIIKMKYLSMV